MILGLILGGILGASDVPYHQAIPMLVGFVFLKGAAEVVFRRSWLTGGPSAYALYLEEMKKTGTQAHATWLRYLALVLLSGCGLGAVSYVVARLVF